MLNKNLNKSELLGVVNVLFGIGYLFVMYQMVFNYVPAQLSILGTEAASPIFFNVIAAVYAVIGFADILAGVKLFQKRESETWYKRGLTLLMVSIVGFLAFPIISTFLVILPIYNLTESL